MKITYVSKNYKISPKFKEILEKKLDKLEKYFNKDCDVRVNCSSQADVEKLEISMNAEGMFYRSEVLSDNMYNNIDLSLPKIEKQIIKYATKNKTKALKDFENKLEFLKELPVMETSKIVKTKKFDLEPQTIEDAEFNLEALGHTFYIFLNAKTGKINVLYKRNDGFLGLIEVEY